MISFIAFWYRILYLIEKESKEIFQGKVILLDKSSLKFKKKKKFDFQRD